MREPHSPLPPVGEPLPPQQPPQSDQQDDNVIGVVGFSFGIFNLFFLGILWLPGFICSVIGFRKANRGAKHRDLALIGIILNLSWLLVGLVLLIFILFFAPPEWRAD